MARSIEQIESDIRKLAAADRNRLLRDLVADLDGAAEPGLDAAWLEAAQQREAELNAGTVQAVPAIQVLDKARSRLRHGP
jgi:hypothetical protein